jgi:hypothetical protein
VLPLRQVIRIPVEIALGQTEIGLDIARVGEKMGFARRAIPG